MKVMLILEIPPMDTKRDLWVNITDYEDDKKYYSGSAKFIPARCVDCKYFEKGIICGNDIIQSVCGRTGDLTERSREVCSKGEWKC